jgi:hypothetical protein
MAKVIKPNDEIDWTHKSADMCMKVGKRCTFDHCGLVDMLPFECKYCKATFCLEHRTQKSHQCTQNVDLNWSPLEEKNIKQEPKYIHCQISKCNQLIENKLTSVMLAKCNKCNTIRCSTCRTEKKCCG